MYSAKTLPYLVLASMLALLTLLVVACGDDEEETLKIGVVLPETGALAAYGGPMIVSVELAEEDIKSGGGAIEVIYADSGTDPDKANESVNRLLGEGAHVIVGAAASGISQAIIQTLYDEKIPQCSPSNTSPNFTGQGNAGYYFRTAPSDAAAAPVIADTVVSRGGTRVSIVARADDYGQALAALLADRLDELGAESDTITYDPQAATFDAEVSGVTSYGPDAIVLIVFDEGVNLIRGLLEAGFDPSTMYGSDGIFRPVLNTSVNASDPNVLDGMTLFVATAPGSDAYDSFKVRLENALEQEGNLAFGAQSYDCTIILALAARAAGSTDGDDIIAAVSEVTGGGRECSSYADCAEGIDDGDDIAYVGKVGRLKLDAGGDPTVATYTVSRFEGGELVEQSTQAFDFSE
ncbi:MAG: ABC transporter substrate-binding protein [Dehalococcoidia bacterium]|nr:ABC transporter substrate-binding protein [Dehalococcoidia bacterium]